MISRYKITILLQRKTSRTGNKDASKCTRDTDKLQALWKQKKEEKSSSRQQQILQTHKCRLQRLKCSGLYYIWLLAKYKISPLLSYEEKLFESYICLRSDIAKKFGQKKMYDIPRLCRLAIIFYSGYEAALSNTTYVNSILMLQT